MRTKLVIIIEVDENLSDTEPLWKAFQDKGELKVKEIFDPEQIVLVRELSDINAQRDYLCLQDLEKRNGELPDPKQTYIKCQMVTRGIN